MKKQTYESPRLIDLRTHEKTIGYGAHCTPIGSAPAATNCISGAYAIACNVGSDVGE